MTHPFVLAVPSDKHDMVAVERARTIGFPILNPAIPDLLVWVQDINWPVAEPVADLLATADKAIEPHLRDVLRSGDGDWVAFTLSYVCLQLAPSVVEGLRPDIERIADDPTEAEVDSGCDEAARDVLLALEYAGR
ncbi:MAG: DUF5071 domain-containing protein [Pseudomonadota bacterium]